MSAAFIVMFYVAVPTAVARLSGNDPLDAAAAGFLGWGVVFSVILVSEMSKKPRWPGGGPLPSLPMALLVLVSAVGGMVVPCMYAAGVFQ